MDLFYIYLRKKVRWTPMNILSSQGTKVRPYSWLGNRFHPFVQKIKHFLASDHLCGLIQAMLEYAFMNELAHCPVNFENRGFSISSNIDSLACRLLPVINAPARATGVTFDNCPYIQWSNRASDRVRRSLFLARLPKEVSQNGHHRRGRR